MVMKDNMNEEIKEYAEIVVDGKKIIMPLELESETIENNDLYSDLEDTLSLEDVVKELKENE